LGIGTSSPSSILSTSGTDTTVYSSSSVGGQDSSATLKIQNLTTAANSFASIDFNTNNNRVVNRIVSGHASSTTDGFLAFVTEGGGVPAERMRIDASGNVGIGETSPSTFGKLVVTGSTPFAVLRSSDVTTAGFSMLVNGGSNGVGSIATDDGGHLTFDTGATGAGQAERMRIDASGNVGIGTSSPSQKLDVKVATDAKLLVQEGNTAGNVKMQAVNNAVSLNTNLEIAALNTQFFNGGTERMRIDASGNLAVGTTVAGARLIVKSNATAILGFGVYGDTTGDTAYNVAQFGKFDNDTTTSQVFVNFVVNNGGAANGQINANGSGAVAFGSWSDRRLKENITDLPNQLANITALRPVEFDYIESEGGGHQLGFIAQEVEEIYPDLVGERQDGMKTLSGMGKMEARLIKAIQEQQATIEALTARIAALES
jgi:trimeric autotransporter adhesin